MNGDWTTDQVVALAPDPASAKNGKGLATLNKWSNLGKDQQIIWGECQGSGKDPYRTQVDLSEPAFRCSCPSRKFPCKHGLGLLFLMVSESTALTNGTPPDWVADWITSRAKREEKQKQKTSEPEKTVDPEAQAKRAKARFNKVEVGIQELQVWLHDLIRQGLTSVSTESYKFWEQPAARMVDAQAPSLARQLRDIPSVIASGAGWQERLLQKLGKLHLLLEGFQRLDDLPMGLQADIRTQIGWTQNQAELTESENEQGSNHLVQDVWLVMGQQVETEERLRVSRTWLWGQSSDRYALYLQFALGTQPFEHNFMLGTSLEAELAFFESAYPLRVIITNRQSSLSPISILDNLGSETIDLAIASYSRALVKSPWLERFPFTLQQVIPIHKEGKWFIRDRAANLLLMSSRFEHGWTLLALSGGHPVTIFGEWNGNDFYPLSILVGDKLYVA
ncbi:SWIM zinc finger family protein [Pseudanabaena sp. FACHB-1998]|uniref:SWIM zinc finger family protein n=1 Tax=Pseudanabaena sp. FACHB-1998 TaxID=2692858 RepID=UPI00168097B3|nr:SWIM zinc finger family protein [Pseudanabaena sp. FACHB-1998]MBD2178298.1 SWIM zinc finger family protein [Pseudanabaena sp. FACHB-1998]